MFSRLFKNKLYIFLGLVFFIISLSGCKKEISLKRVEPIMGTYVGMTVIASNQQKAEGAIKDAFSRIKTIDALTSIYKPDSQISRLNSLGELKVSPQTLDIVKRSLYFSELTKGALDITYKPIMDVWQKAKKLSRRPDDDELSAAASRVDYRNILIEGNLIKFKKPGMSIDLSCIAKGYAVDKAIDSLRQKGIEKALVNAGGDIYALGRRSKDQKWQIGIQDPRDSDKLIATIELENKAVATSGNYENYSLIEGKRYSFIFNPRSGRPADSLISATVIADDSASADALATACFILGAEKALKLIAGLKDAEAIIINADNEVIYSQGMSKFLVNNNS